MCNDGQNALDTCNSTDTFQPDTGLYIETSSKSQFSCPSTISAIHQGCYPNSSQNWYPPFMSLSYYSHLEIANVRYPTVCYW